MQDFAGTTPHDSDGLISHIRNTYHASHRHDLPRLCAIARKVERHHADDPHAPRGLCELLRQTWRDLEDHLEREERLFPAMLGGADGVDETLARMREDHAGYAARLRRIAELTRGFTPPEGACPEWWALYAMTFSFVDDLDEHMRLENEVLFPRYESRPS